MRTTETDRENSSEKAPFGGQTYLGLNPPPVPFLLGDPEHLRSPQDPPIPSMSHLPEV